MWFFPVLGFALEEKLCGTKCCEYYRREGVSKYCHSFVDMANQDSPLWERVGMDHDLSPPWTLLNMTMAIKFGLFIIPPEQRTLKRNKAFEW